MSLTHIELTSSASCSVRGKLVWPNILWFGAKGDSFLLINKLKSKLLNIDDGSITKHIPLIDRLISESFKVSASKDGKLLVGVKKSGDIFVWEFSRNVVYSISGLSQFKQKADSLQIFISGDVERILVVKNCNTYHLWSRQEKTTKFKFPPKLTALKGRWFALDVAPQIPLPTDGTEAKVDNLGLEQDIFSSVAFVRSDGVLCLSTVHVTAEPSLYAQRTDPLVQWYTQPIAGSSAIPIISTPDLLLVRYAPTLPICAVVINQLSVRDRCLIFVSPQHHYQVAANLKCLRESPVSGRRPLWIADVQWTYNSLLLMVLTQCGCVAILSRLGNPLYITTREMYITGAFDHLISLLPRNITSPRKGNKMNRSLSLSSVTQQGIVSMSSHHSVMKFLISDGCQVMIFQIPEDITTRSLAMALLSDARMLTQRKLHSSPAHATDSLDVSTSEEPVDLLVGRNSLRALMQVWCLLVSADSWSKELKDVSNEVVVTIADIVRSLISPHDIEGSAVKLTHATIHLVTMVAIDSHRQHVLPASIKLISTIVEAILAYTDCSTDTLIRLSEIAYVLIMVCENTLNRTYSLLPMLDTHVMGGKSETKFTHEVVGDTHLTMERVVTATEKFESIPSNQMIADTSPNESSKDIPSHKLTSLNVTSTSSVSACLAPLYKRLHTHLTRLYSYDGQAMVDPSKLHRLLEVVQGVLGQRYPYSVSGLNTVWLHSDILYLEGFHSSAINEWLNRCTGAEQTHGVTGALHSILYSNLYNSKLVDVLQFVEGLILNNLSKQSHHVDKEYLNIKCLPGSPVKKLVQSLARFMARYFTNSDLYVFPSHNPSSLPPLYSLFSDYIPVLRVDRSGLCAAARKLPSDDLWSVGATVRYLLISGLLAELVWFCKAIGDLKSSLCVSLIVSDHLTSLKHIKRQQVNSLLPEELKPESIHGLMFGEFLQGNQVTCGETRSSIYQMILPTALFGLPCLTSQLSHIWQRIKVAASKLSAFVPNDLYLPSPAMYCPQVPSELQEVCEELRVELELRETLSSDIQTMINLLVATNTDLACCGWLVRGLLEAWKHKTTKKSKLRLPKALEVYLPYHIAEKDKHNKLTFALFRNSCCILWMLHVRDTLSLMLRKSTELLMDCVTVFNKPEDTDFLKVRYVHLEETLSWCLRYLPFSQYLQSANTLCEVIISICEDLPATAKLARKLARGITDIDSLAPEVKDRMDHLLQTWQTVDLDPHKSRSLSMYYFDCCNKFEDRSDGEATEKHIFGSVQGHKTIGSRIYEYDTKFLEFIELYFGVSFNPSLPGGGTAKSPALVSTNRKTLEQNSFSRRTLSFDTGTNTLESTIAKHTIRLGETMDGTVHAEQASSDNPNKSGMFTRKRWSVNEERTIKQMKKMGVTLEHRHSELSPERRTGEGLNSFTLTSTTPSLQMLTQHIQLSERYQKLGVKFQWLLLWCDTQLNTSNSQQSGSKVSIDLQWMILALIMVEKGRQSHTRTTEYGMLPPPAAHVTAREEQPAIKVTSTEHAPAIQISSAEAPAAVTSKSLTASVDYNSSALANAISLHTSTVTDVGLTDEEDSLDREELLEEMRRHSRMATATQPINKAYPRSSTTNGTSPVEKLAIPDEESGGDINTRESADSFLLDESATTVWSSASLPNLSGSSLITATAPPETIDTVEPQSTGKTQQSVSTIGSRKSRSRRRTPERLRAPIAESTQYEEQLESTAQSTPRESFNSQIPLLRLTKENENKAYYSSDAKSHQLLQRNKKPDLLSVRDVNSFDSQPPVQQPDSVKLPLLSLRPAASASTPAMAGKASFGYDQFQLAEIRQNDTRWGQPIPLLHAQQPDSLHIGSQQREHVPDRPVYPGKPTRSTAMAYGPALLQQYDESNRQKDEVLTRMIQAMRSKAKPVIEEGRPTHPKYQLLKLDVPKSPSSSPKRTHHGTRQRKEETSTADARHSGQEKRGQRKKRRQKTTSTVDLSNQEDLATVSERTEPAKTVDVGTDLSMPATTVDKAVQHTQAHTDGQFTDYSYLFALATAKDGAMECDVQELDAAANDNTFAAVQYKAIKLQGEAEKRPQMVDAAVMAVEPSRTKTIIVRSEDDTSVPAVAPNIIHDLEFTAPRVPVSLHDKENIPERKRDYIGVADITPTPTILPEPSVAVPSQPRSQQILSEIEANRLTTGDLPDKLEKPYYVDKPPLVPYHEAEELRVPRVITPRARFESADGKDEGKLTIARNLSNMDDRLEYIEELRDVMMRQINETEMVLPRYHISYQQRQTQTRLSMPTEEEYATILQPAPQQQLSTRRTKSARGEKSQPAIETPPGVEDNMPATPTARTASSHRTATSIVTSVIEEKRSKHTDTQDSSPIHHTLNSEQPVTRYTGTLGSSAVPRSARSDDGSSIQDASEMLKLAEQIVGDDLSIADVNSSMLADLLGSDVSFLSQKLGESPRRSKTSAQRKEELKKWRKENQAKVREKYNQDVGIKRRPETRPFQSQNHLTAKQIKKVKEERQVKREQMIANNQSKRIESAENLLEDLLVDGAELLAMERMMDLTTPIVSKKSTASKKSIKPSRLSPQKKTAAFQRGKSIIRAPSRQNTGYTPSGFHTVAHPSSTALGHTLMDASSYDVDELPLYDESQMLVPIFRGEQEDRERIHQLLYSDEAMSKYGSEMNLSDISDLAPRSEVSGESYLDWDVVDEMVAMLSNRGSSTPSTPAGLI